MVLVMTMMIYFVKSQGSQLISQNVSQLISQDLWVVLGRCVATKGFWIPQLNDGHPMVIHDRWQQRDWGEIE